MFLELVTDPPYKTWNHAPNPKALPGLPSLPTALRATEEERMRMLGECRWQTENCVKHASDRLATILDQPQARNADGDPEADVHLYALFSHTPDEALALLERIQRDRCCTVCHASTIPSLHAWLGDRSTRLLIELAVSRRNSLPPVFPTTLSPLLVPTSLEELTSRWDEGERARGLAYLRRFASDLAPVLVALAAGADPTPLGSLGVDREDDDGRGDPRPSIAWQAGHALSMLARIGREADVLAAAKTLGLEKVARRFIAMPPMVVRGEQPKGPKLPDTICLEGKTLDAAQRAALLGLLARIDWIHARRDADELRKELDDKSRTAIAQGLAKAWRSSKSSPERWVGQAAIALAPERVDDIITPPAKRKLVSHAQRRTERMCVTAMADCAILHPDLRERMFARIGALALDPVKVRAHLRATANEVLVRAAWELGLNPDTLDDRTIPSLGFDATGKKMLDWSGRPVEVWMTPGLELVFVVDGERKDSPPAPRKGDNKKKIAVAKKEIEKVRKEARILARGLAGRIERWMRDRQRWDTDEFVRDVLGHPVLRSIAQGFVWGTYDGLFEMNVVRTFRIAEDGTFADENDASFQPSGRVGVVHAGEIDAALRQKWGTVLADYEILPIVPQLELRALTEEQKQRDRIDHPSPKGYSWRAARAASPPSWNAARTYRAEDEDYAWSRILGRHHVTIFFKDTSELYARVRPIECRERKWMKWGDVDAYTAHEMLVDLDAFQIAIEKAS